MAAEMDEQPKLDMDERPTTEPEYGPESDSVNDERAQASVSETISKASEPQPELLLLGKQLASSDQNEATQGEANTTTTESEDSGEQFEVVQLSSFSKEKPSIKVEEGGTTTTPPQDDGDRDEESQDETKKPDREKDKESQDETKEPDREKEACEEKPALQADREDQEVIAPTQAEEGGADSGRTTPKEEVGTVLGAEKEAEVSVGSTISGEASHAEREEGSDEKMEVEASEAAVDRGTEDTDGGGAISEEQQQESGDSVEEDMPEMETENRIDGAIQSLVIESKGEAESGDIVMSTSNDAAPPMEEDTQKEGGELSETKMEIESAVDENVESTESEDVRKNEITSKDSIPPEADVETRKETATEHASPSEDDMETGNVTVMQSDAVPVEKETDSVEASEQEETTTQPGEDGSNLRSTYLPPLEDKQVDLEPAKDNEGNFDMAEDRPPPTNRDDKEGESEEEEKKDNDEQGLSLVQLGGAIDEASVEQEADKGSMQKQEDGIMEGTVSVGDSTEAEPNIAKQDSDLKEPVETVEADDNSEKVESDITPPERPMEPDAVEQKDEDEAFKLELSFESSEPETVPSKETSIQMPADAEKSEVEKEPDEAMDEAIAPSVLKGDEKQEVGDKDKSEMGAREGEEPADNMEIADSSVEKEEEVPDAQEESATAQEPQTTKPAVVADQSSIQQKASHLVEVLQDTSGKTPESADEVLKVTSSSPVQSETSDPKEATSLDESSKQPLPSTETSAAAPPSSNTTSAPAAGTASVGTSPSADINVDTAPASTVSTGAVKEAVTCIIKTTVTVSTPPQVRVDPYTTSKAPPTSSSSSEALPTTTLTSTSTPSVAPPTTTSSSSKVPSQAPPATTPTSIPMSSVAFPTSSSSSEEPSQTLPTTTPTSIETPFSVAPPATTSSASFKVPSLTNVPSLSLLAARSSALPHVLSTARATSTQAKSPSSVVQFTSDIGAKLPPFDSPGNVGSVPTITIPAVSKSKFSSSSGGGISTSATKVASHMSTAASSSVSTVTPMAQLSNKAISTAVSAMTSSSTATTPTSSSSPISPSITTTAHHKSSQQQLPSLASKPHANTISVITKLPASFTASKAASSLSSVATSTAAGLHIAAVASGGGHHGIVLGVGSLQQREQNIIGIQGAEKLKVGEAEVLQVSGDSDLRLQQQKIEVKSREEMMGKVPPQVAVIPPIIDLTRTPEYSQIEKLKGQGMSGDVGKGRKSPSILVDVAAASTEGQQRGHSGEMKNVEKTTAGQELKSPIGELKASAHPVARRIWMSSCRPLDPASLERIGVDSKGTVYWYDGGKNMFQSPPSNDPAYKPSESELQLSCKSMVQWTAKLKELRHSNVEADMKLAQTIKDQFLSRVRIATQRKPRDLSVIQKLQAVHSIRPTQLSPQQQQQQQQQQQASISKPTITLTTSQAAAAVASAGGAVAIATGGSGGASGTDSITATQQKTAQIVQGSFPQGSILVVPHPTHPFHAVLPVFANTAVLMPQAAAAVATTTTTSAAGSIVGSPPTTSLVLSQSSTNDKKAKTASAGRDKEGAKVPSSVATAAGGPQTILVQAPATSQSLAALQASPSTVIQLSGSRNNVPVVSTSEKAREGSASKDRSTTSKEKQQSTEAVHVQQQAQKGGITLTSPQTATIALHPSFLPQALASGMIAAVPGGGLKIQDYRQALALSAMIPVMPIKVGDPVKLSTIDFESKSIEISGEVPIKMVEVDKETGKLVPVSKHPDLEQLRQKGMAVESEKAPSGKEGEESSNTKKPKATDEESHIDVEEGSKKQGQGGDDKAAKSHLAKEKEGAFTGHSSSDIMSAQLLLSLTDGPHKDWSTIATPPLPAAVQQPPIEKVPDSPAKSLLTKEASIVLTPVSLKSSGRDETASPASSTSQRTTASGGRKRKQKPIASAKPDNESATTTPTPTPKGRKGGRKVKQGAVQEESTKDEGGSTGAKSSTAKKKQASDKTTAATVGNKDTPGRSKQFSPEELLVLLDIPPSSSSPGKGSSKNKTQTTKAKGKAKDKSNLDGRYVLQSSNATAKMEELKASRAGKPMKEYVIETDSDSADSSSSGTSSSRFSPDSGSSSESSSDSSSEEGGGGEGSETKAKPPPKKVPARSSKGGVARGRGGRGRGGRAQRKGKKGESSSAESSSEDEEEFESKKKPTARGRGGGARGGRGGRGSRGATRQETTPKQQGKGQSAGHIVSIPTNLLSHKPVSGKKRKATSKTAEAEKATTADYIPDLPVDLATLYATKGGVDLGTLSELTKCVKDDDIDIGIVGGSRSKRTCVRMREEITKLQEILKDNGSPEVKPSPPAKTKTTSTARMSTKARPSSGRTSDVGSGGAQESTTVAGSLTSSAPAKKYKRPAYSQFTHKRRKRRKKQPEEEALWQPASRKGGSGETYKPVYLFSTFLANKAAAAVEKNRYNSIIQFHQAQPKDPGFLRLPQTTEKQSKPQRGSVSDRKQTDVDSGEEEMSAKETKSTPRGQKRRNSGRTSEGGSATRRTRNSEVENADRVPSPQPFLRSSRRLRQQRNRSNPSPPPLQSPTSPDGPRSPLPPSPPSGVRPRPRKTSQNTAGGSGSVAQQRSQRRKRNNQQQHEESPTSPLSDLFGTRSSQQVEEMDSPSDDEERVKDGEMSDGGIGARKRARFDEGEADKNLLSSPGMQSPEQQRSIPAPNSREEENYTICHGTPVNKTTSDDISSPKNWPPSSSSSHHHSQQQQQQIQNQQQLQHAQLGGQYPHHPHHHLQQQQQLRSHEQQMQQYVANTSAHPATGHSAQHQQQQQQQHRAPSTPSSEATTFSPSMLHPESSSSPGFDHRSVAAAAGAGGGHAASGGAGLNSGGRGAEYAHRQHQLMSAAAEHAHLRDSSSSWATAGLHPHQFQSVPGAYPGAYPPMYNPASIPGMHYHGQPMPSANYPYPMPYHWGHHHPSAAAAAVPQLGEHMLQQQHHHHQQQQHRQVATSKEMPSHHEVLQHPHISGHTPESPQSSSLLMRGGSSPAQSVSVTSSSTAAGKPSSRGHYPSPQAAALHQLASPGSATASHALSHQLPHNAEHLPPGAHQAAAATFPYGFDSSGHSLSHMHMLQQSQMQPQLTRPLHGVPPHHIPPHMAPRGIWYSPQHMAAHQMIPGAIGAEIPGHPGHSKKAASKSSKSTTSVDSDKNRNANNNNASIVRGAPANQRARSTQEFISAGAYKSPTAVAYPSGAHNSSSSSSSSITPGATFSIENITAPYSGAHVMGVLTTPHTPPTGEDQRFGSNAGEGSLPAVSTILERTRQD